MRMFAARPAFVALLTTIACVSTVTGFQQPRPAFWGVPSFKKEVKAFEVDFAVEEQKDQLELPCVVTGSQMALLEPINEPGDAQMSAKSIKMDLETVATYATAIAVQMSLFYGLFTVLDKLVVATSIKISFAFNWIFFYVCAWKSRIFHPLAIHHHKAGSLEEELRAPSWKQPSLGFRTLLILIVGTLFLGLPELVAVTGIKMHAFAMWLILKARALKPRKGNFNFRRTWFLLFGPLCASASALLYRTTTSYVHPAFLSLMLHLSIGDAWNTINSIENRFGVSLFCVSCFWLSQAFAAWLYYRENGLAGKLLAVPLIWLTIRAGLLIATWRSNPRASSVGSKEALYPVVAEQRKISRADD